MSQNFSKQVSVDGKAMLVVIVPELRKDGMYYEINVKGYPRFYMSWSPLGRYDAMKQEHLKLPYELILAVSDVIEEKKKKGR